jgi:adenylosuccinate synthase
MRAIAIIGANYGDEGKGLTIDYLAREQAAKGQRPLIVRFNGGSQAGHTVQTGDGRRHVFSHVGAGSFAPNARTYLSSQFIVNPYTLRKELVQLQSTLTETPIIMVHPMCPVTTIYDMALNSIAELSRGQERHGSCGMGINETVTRNLAGHPLKLWQVVLRTADQLATDLKLIVERWVPQRLEALGLTQDDLNKHQLYSAVLTTKLDFVKQAELLKELVEPLIMLNKDSLESLQASIEHDQAVLFEGAQGLALDEFLGTFPYVTRSITGLPSALAVAAFELGALEVEPLYISRCYLTRHGAGPLHLEGESITDKPLHDLTNIENMWQGALRKAPLNLQQMKDLLTADATRALSTPAVLNKGAVVRRPQLMLTCLDQLGAQVNVVNAAGVLTTVASAELPLFVARELGREISVSFCSFGPTSQHIKSWT